VSGIILIVGFLVYLWVCSGNYVLCTYLAEIFVVCVFFVGLGFIYPREIHLHHYTSSGILVCLLAHHHILIAILNGLFTGIYVEGCCRWSLASNIKVGRKYMNKWFKPQIKQDEGPSIEDIFIV
jgi:hypothetical protein